MTEEELRITVEYFYQVLMSKESGEKAINYFANFLFYAYSPIYYDLPEF